MKLYFISPNYVPMKKTNKQTNLDIEQHFVSHPGHSISWQLKFWDPSWSVVTVFNIVFVITVSVFIIPEHNDAFIPFWL